MEISYSQCGDYLIPNLVLPDEEQLTIGKYGRMRKRYLQEHRPVLYSNLVLSCKLYRFYSMEQTNCAEKPEDFRSRALKNNIPRDSIRNNIIIPGCELGSGFYSGVNAK